MTLSHPLHARSLAVLLAIAVGALAWLALIEPWQARNRELDKQIAATQRLIAGFQTVAAARPGLEQQLRNLPKPNPDQSSLFIGSSETVVLADLQDRVRSLVEQQRGVTRSTSVLEGVAEGPFRRIGVRVQVQTTTAGLYRLLYALETMHPLVLVDNLAVQAQSGPSSARDDPQLETSFDVIGYLDTNSR